MKYRGKRCFGILMLAVCGVIAGCSAQRVYQDQQTTAELVKTEQGGYELQLYIQVPPEKPSRDLEEALTQPEPVREYEIRLSDGTYYTYSDGTADGAGGVCPQVFSLPSELEETIGKKILYSEEILYPEQENNLLLLYDPVQSDVTVTSAKMELSDGTSVCGEAFMNLGEKNSRYHCLVQGVSEELCREEYPVPGGGTADVYLDDRNGTACICLVNGGCVTCWKLEGELNLQKVRGFVDSLL